MTRVQMIGAAIGLTLAALASPASAQQTYVCTIDCPPAFQTPPAKPATVAAAPVAEDETITYSTPASVSIARPVVRDRGVFIAQIGNANSASVTQTARAAAAAVRQTGDRNNAAVEQRGQASGFVDLAQTGDMNTAEVAQNGVSGGNTLYLAQTGTGNVSRVMQSSAGNEGNAAILAQVGNGNSAALDQNGSDNLAMLAQDGENNAMTASQLGNGNRLVWTQQGNNLSNLSIVQPGGQSMQITQTK